MAFYVLVLCFLSMLSIYGNTNAVPLLQGSNSVSLPATNPEKVESLISDPNLSTTKLQKSIEDSDELLDTANSIVFRPLFAYRKQVAQRRRIYNNNKNGNSYNNNRRQGNNRPQSGYPYGYPAYGYPYYYGSGYRDREFPHVP